MPNVVRTEAISTIINNHIKLSVNKSLYQVPAITPPPMSDSRTPKIWNILQDYSKTF